MYSKDKREGDILDIKEWLTSDLSVSEYNKKYRYENETFDEFLERITNGDKEVQQLIIDKKFIYGGRILANRGLQKLGKKITYSNCYVLSPPEDNIESIYETCGKLARTFSYGGGVGIDISKLRPKGAPVNNAARTTTGAVSFMPTFSQVAETIGQKGRRGALMISMDVSHPDIEEFIDIKTDLNAVTKANISVKITDDFIKAVKNNTKYPCKFTLEDGSVICKYIDANKIMDKLALNNHRMGEPGILYWDKIQNYNLMQHFEDFGYAGVNPCAEEPLPAGGSCLLGAINLSEFIVDPFTPAARFDFDEFERVVYKAIFALNDVLIEGMPLHPLKEQQETVGKLRQIGLGIMGLADALIKLGITYGSSESLLTIETIGTALLYNSLIASSEYAKLDGNTPFEGYDAHKVFESDIIQNLINNLNYYEVNTLKVALQNGLFNSQLTTIAPTGTIAGLCNTSYGVEPNFAYSYTRKTESLHEEGDVYYTVEPKIVEDYRKATGNKGELPDYFITTHQLDPFNRVDVQATIQKYIDASISSTVNLPESTTPEEIKAIYLYGAEKGVKGLTIFRNNCERMGILTVGDNKEEDTDDLTPVERAKSMLKFGDTILVDDSVIGIKRKLKTGCGSLHCTFYFCPETGELREVFLDKGSKGGCLSLLNAMSRLASLCARKGAPVEEIADQLESVLVCPSYSVSKFKDKTTSKGSSCASAVAYALIDAHNQFLEDFIDPDDDTEIEIKAIRHTEKPTLSAPKKQEPDDYYMVCPECGEKALLKTEGCVSCVSCGYSKCG